MSHRPLTDRELAFLAAPPQRALARIATVDDDGMPHVVPGGWSYDRSRNELVLGGHDVVRTRRARHVESSRVAAVVIDGVLPEPGWRPWAFVARGRARLDREAGAIRISLDDVRSWGLEFVVASDA